MFENITQIVKKMYCFIDSKYKEMKTSVRRTQD